MATGILEIVKLAAMDAEENGKPTDLRYGKVISDDPLKVEITNQFKLPASMLIVPQHLTEYEVEVEMDWSTTGSGDHSHRVSGKKKLIIHNQLKVGDKVALLRERGGKAYYILDRLRGD